MILSEGALDDGVLSVEEEESTDFVMWIDVAARLVVWGIIRLWEESRCVYHLQLLCMFIVGKMREILDCDCERRTMHYWNLITCSLYTALLSGVLLQCGSPRNSFSISQQIGVSHRMSLSVDCRYPLETKTTVLSF